MEKVEVDLVWLLRVRDLLYKLSTTEDELGEQAEMLGSYFPDFLQEEN